MIEIKNVSKAYNGINVLDNYNAVIDDNGVTCFRGPSGCGKTTLLNIILGLINPDSGEIKGIEGLKVSCVFQEDRLLEWGSALNNVMFVLKHGEEEKAKKALLLADLSLDIHDKQVTELSGGMRRRVAIARALAVEFDILIMDEPFKGLDAPRKNQVMEHIKHYSKDKAVIIVTHDQLEIEAIADKVYNM